MICKYKCMCMTVSQKCPLSLKCVFFLQAAKSCSFGCAERHWARRRAFFQLLHHCQLSPKNQQQNNFGLLRCLHRLYGWCSNASVVIGSQQHSPEVGSPVLSLAHLCEPIHAFWCYMDAICTAPHPTRLLDAVEHSWPFFPFWRHQKAILLNLELCF